MKTETFAPSGPAARRIVEKATGCLPPQALARQLFATQVYKGTDHPHGPTAPDHTLDPSASANEHPSTASCTGPGRRKTAVAGVRVWFRHRSITINGRPVDNYLNYNPKLPGSGEAPRSTPLALPAPTTCWWNVQGRRLHRPADAIKPRCGPVLGGGRRVSSPDNAKPLNDEGPKISRDPRAKERRK